MRDPSIGPSECSDDDSSDQPLNITQLVGMIQGSLTAEQVQVVFSSILGAVNPDVQGGSNNVFEVD